MRSLAARGEQGLWIDFPEPLKTRGLRLTITKVSGPPQVASIWGYHVFSEVDENVPSVEAASSEATPPPFQVAYQQADEGSLTMVVRRSNGTLARNLISRRWTQPGKTAEAWDLKDEDGQYITPGEYEWSAISHPKLQVKYEMTVYPNVSENSPENAPWITSTNGPDGWMADHTQPTTVAAIGKHVYLGSPCAESGVSLIETDLKGKKSWAFHSFAAWTGPRELAAGEDRLYVGSPENDTNKDNIWTVDHETKEVKQLLSLAPSSTRRRGMRGLAAYEGQLYISVNGGSNYMEGPATPNDVDVSACLPIYPPGRAPKGNAEYPPDPRGDFLGLFRLTGNPPGLGEKGSLQFLQSERTRRRKTT